MAGLWSNAADDFLPAGVERIVHFPDTGKSYEIIKPITDFRVCHDGTPAESRIVFTCKEVPTGAGTKVSDEGFILKVKVQSAIRNEKPVSTPSTTTAAEIHALQLFQETDLQGAPHLVTWKLATQGEGGLLPGGFITYVLMATLPGETLFTLHYWQLPAEEREAIVQEFLAALRQIHALGIEPTDRGLRNILWDQQTKKCNIIDFESWNQMKNGVLSNYDLELMRWGLVRIPPTVSHFTRFNLGM